MTIARLLCFALIAVAVVLDQVTAKTFGMETLNKEESSGYDEEENATQMEEKQVQVAPKPAPGNATQMEEKQVQVAPKPAPGNETQMEEGPVQVAPKPAPISAPVLPPTPAPTPECKHTVKWINHDQIRPFVQPEPVSLSEKVAIRFKPMLRISSGCDPYPMVTSEGETGGGLKPTGHPRSKCKGAPWGAQIYGRSSWFKGYWVLMYVWYFPKDSPSPHLGHRHDFEHVLLWLDNPSNVDPKILAVSVSSHNGYEKYVSPDLSTLSGTHVKINYFSSWPLNHELDTTPQEGGFQDLIMWHQLPEKARCALNSVYWGDANLPIRDENFWQKMKAGYPF